MGKTIPKPLFDTLEQMLRNNVSSNLAYIKHQADYENGKNFILSYRGSKDTFNSYRREIERLLQWSWLIANKSIFALSREDFEKYLKFCQKPPKSWLSNKNVARFIGDDDARLANPSWRPFVYKANNDNMHTIISKQENKIHYNASNKSIREIFTICQSFYNYLLTEKKIDYNPVAQIRQKTKYFSTQQSQTVIRKLSELQWSFVIETVEIMANENPAVHERTLFIMNALYAMYLRISELVANSRWQPKMGDFIHDLDGNWWFKTVGKGNKERLITVSDDMLQALKRYRIYLGLPAHPSPNEQTHLLTKYNGIGPISSTRHIRYLVQKCFDRAISRMEAMNFTQEAQDLKAATVHWLRHTGISNDVKVRPREHVRDDAGHSSSAITDKYIDIELRERHASGKKKKIKPEWMTD